MNKELALRTLAYLKTHYNNNDETIIDKEDIDAINFVLDDNEKLSDLINEYENIGYDIAQERADFLLEIQRLNNIIDELKWKPIDEYFKNKENYDWVLIKYYDKYNFECIPSVAEYRFGKWYLKDNDEPLQDFEIRYFFDMQQLDKLKELKENKI